MWVVVVLLLLVVFFGWKRREGYMDPADEAEKQSGDLRYTQKKFANLGAFVSEDELDKRQVEITKLEQKVNDLEVKMKTLLETKRVNDTQGYPKT